MPVHTSINDFFYKTAWYDYDLVSYQKERIEANELERTFEERNQYLQQQGIDLTAVDLRPKVIKGAEPEWAKSVKEKKDSDYYSKLQELETEQLVKEQRIRGQSHQFAIPGEKVVKSSVAKGMAQQYESQL
jgi:titin